MHIEPLTQRRIPDKSSGVAQLRRLYYESAMFKAKVIGSFAAAHSLRGYQGDCEKLHGHNYRVEVVVAAEELDEIGILIDFREMKRILKIILDELDHCYLNELAAFSIANASAENLARHIYQRFAKELAGSLRMHEVTVWENDGCCVTYSE